MIGKPARNLVLALLAFVVLALVGRAFGATTCERRLGKETSRYAQARAKLVRVCEDRKVKGRLPANTVCESEPTTSQLLARARAKLVAAVGASCGGPDGACGTADDPPLAGTGWASTPVCPGIRTGSCSGAIASCADVLDCLACVVDQTVRDSVGLAYGALASSEFGTASPLNKCQRALGKETAKFYASRAKALQKCWDARLSGAHSNVCPAPGDNRAVATIQRAEAKKRTRICRACGGADHTCAGGGDFTPSEIGFAGTCPNLNPPSGGACARTVSALTDVVDCVDCVASYATDCASALPAPSATAYPAACLPSGATTTTTTTVPGSTTTTTTQPGGTTTTTTQPGGTTTTTTTQSGSTTTTTTLPLASFLDFTTATAGGTCGHTYTDTSGTTVLKNLTCGGLNLGGGNSTVPEGPTPDGATSRFNASCTGSSCTLSATAAAGTTFDCTTTGCNFGPPLPIANGSLSVCTQNTFAAPANGTLDLASGASDVSVSLSSNTIVTGNAAQPCPICRSGSISGPACAGTPASPCTGVCEGSPNQGAACKSTNSQGLSRDCPQPASGASGNKCYKGTNNGGACTSNTQCPGGTCSIFVGTIPVDLTPLSTGTRELSAADGNFCPAQKTAGCFTNPNSTSCRLIREVGVPAGPLSSNVPATSTLASTFCIPATGNILIDGAAALPGPGAISLPGTVRFVQGATTTTTVPGTTTTTTTLPGQTTTTTTTTTTVTTSTTSTTTASTSTTTTTVTTTTTTTAPPGTRVVDFTTTPGAGSCGSSRDGSSALIQDLACGALDLGGGSSSVPEGPVPDGATSRFVVTSCNGSACTIGASAGGAEGIDCTSAGCNFGPPLPIPNGGLSVCVVNTFASNASGTLDTSTGVMSSAVPLSSHIFVTGNAPQPCPLCTATGSAGNPAMGTCDRGARQGLTCTTTNSQGLSSDCLPGGNDGGTDLGNISVDLSPVITGTASKSNANGLFCPGQTASNGNEGCFGSTACRSFSELGTPAGPVTLDVPAPVALASAFCIPATGNILIDGAASLPGPGAASLTGVITLHELGSTTTTTTLTPTTTTTTTTLAGSTTTTTTTTTTTSTTTTLLPLPPLTLEFASTVPTGAACGSVRNGVGTEIMPLACGDLALGAGASGIPPSALPDGAVNHFSLNTQDLGCVLSLLTACPIGPTVTAGPGFDCTTTGCKFGPPVPIPNGALSACSLSTFSAPSTGTANLLTGATTANVSLSLHLFVTGNSTQPCPRCSATGSPGAPGTGTCDRGARTGLSCTTTNSHGLSNDCQPGGTDGSIDLGAIAANLSPVTTGTVSKSNPGGLFCPSQTSVGCFGEPTCRSFTETGLAPNATLAAVTPQPATLVSTFCVPSSGNILVDGSADLPGPAAISLPGNIRANF